MFLLKSPLGGANSHVDVDTQNDSMGGGGAGGACVHALTHMHVSLHTYVCTMGFGCGMGMKAESWGLLLPKKQQSKHDS